MEWNRGFVRLFKDMEKPHKYPKGLRRNEFRFNNY